MSAFVEALDLSHNDITALDDKCFNVSYDQVFINCATFRICTNCLSFVFFQHLKRVTTLHLDHNAIDTIDLDAFYSLKELKYLSLSYNRIEHFDRRILEQNTKLIALNLAGNNFMSIANQPILKSQSLEVCRRNCFAVALVYNMTI